MYEYAKVILYAYPKLNDMAEAVLQGAENKAALSYRATGSTLALAEKIAEELFLGQRIRELYEAMGKLLTCLSGEERFLLEYKYFRRKKILRAAEGGENLSCSERSYYRKQSALLKKVCAYLAARGVTEETFPARFGDFPCFMKLYRALKAGKEHALTQKRNQSGLRFQKSARSPSGSRTGLLPRTTNTATATAAAHNRQMTTI